MQYVKGLDNAMPCHRTGYGRHKIAGMYTYARQQPRYTEGEKNERERKKIKKRKRKIGGGKGKQVPQKILRIAEGKNITITYIRT